MLLDKKVNTRCCNVSTLKGTSFFKGFDWNKLLDFSIPPPFLPLEFPLDKSLLNSRESFERKIVLDEQNSKAYKMEQIREDFDNNYNNGKWAEDF